MIRIQAQEGQESVTGDVVLAVEAALQDVDPSLTFTSVESVGPKVSGELIQTAIIAVAAALAAALPALRLARTPPGALLRVFADER